MRSQKSQRASDHRQVAVCVCFAHSGWCLNGSQFVGRSDKGLLILTLCLACRQVLKGCYYRDDCCCCYCLVTQVCLTLCDRIDCSLPGSSVHGILQARTLEWVAMPSSRGSSQPRDRTCISYLAGGFFTAEPPEMIIITLKIKNRKKIHEATGDCG